MQNQSRIPSWIRRLALGTTVLTWLLIMVGGIVHGTGSSLACPDWPTCHGTFFPVMKGGVFFEHSHRLLAASVGSLTVLLCILLLWKGDRKSKGFGIGAVALVVFQGVLGGLTVIYRLPPAVSTAHLATSMLFFALLASLSFHLYRQEKPSSSEKRSEVASSLLPWTWVAALAVYLQVLSGALMRHLGAGLACLDIPLCQGRIWSLDMTTLQKIHMVHRLGAVAVAFVLLLTAWKIFRASKQKGLKILSAFLPGAIVAQIALGLMSVHSTLDVAWVTAHLGLGALIWLSCVLILLQLKEQKGKSSTREDMRVSSNLMQPSAPLKS